jgi:hypothetical protein
VDLSAVLPLELRDALVDLSAWGTSESALPLQSARAAIDLLTGKDVAILGGDIWLGNTTDRGYHSVASEVWASNRRANEPWHAFVERSAVAAIDHLDLVEGALEGHDIYVVLVAADELHFDKLKRWAASKGLPTA